MKEPIDESGAKRHLWPNVGAEEGPPEQVENVPAVVTTRALFAGLFDRQTTPLPDDLAPAAAGHWTRDWADAAAAHGAPAFDVLGETRGLVPWLVTEPACELARTLDLPVFGPSAEIVREVHDKAFAVLHAEREVYEPRPLQGASAIFSPDEVTRAEGFASAVRDRVQSWTPALGAHGFTLKPRLGTSGRGRVAGRVEPFEPEPIERAAPRLAERGGAILEPWLKRETDLSVVAWLSRHGTNPDFPSLTLLAALEQVVTSSGLWLGHRGEVDRRGRIWSGTPHDDAMRESTASVANAAHAVGHHGPCGVDGFTFEWPDEAGGPPRTLLRPIVELNARFTMGHVCAGWVRRALPWLVGERALEPGRRVAFVFALAPPKSAEGWQGAVAGLGADVLPLPFATPIDARSKPLELASMPAAEATRHDHGPALIFHEERSALDGLAAALRG